MSPEEAKKRAAIVAEARTWLRCPYHHLGDLKGVGTDCAMLLVCTFRKVMPELVPADFDPRPYAPEWYLHQREEKYLNIIQQFAKRTYQPRPGDISVYRFARPVSHGAIILNDELMIHANRATGIVELCERRALADRLDSYWSVF